MSNKVYCSECGNPTPHQQAKPKFCSSCGTSFGGVAAPKVIVKNRPFQKTVNHSNDGEGEETDDYEPGNLPNMDALAVDILPDSPNKESLASVMGTSPDMPANTSLREAGDTLSSEEIMNMIKAESSTLRQK